MKNRVYFIVILPILLTLLASCSRNHNATTNHNGSVLTSIEVTPVAPSIAKGTTQTFTATGRYSDNTSMNITTQVEWSSSDAAVVIIDSSGAASAINVGIVTIQAKTGPIAGTTLLNVTDATLRTIDITPTNPSIAAGTSQQFVATGAFSDNTTQDISSTATWMSSNTSVASLGNTAGSKGQATSLAAGTITITASFSGISGTTTLTVTSATLVSLAVTPSSPSIAAGTSQQFTATGTFSDGTSQDVTSSVTWDSSDTSVAAINNASGSQGKVTSMMAGTSTISASLNGISNSTFLTVTPAVLASIEVTPADPGIVAGTSQQFYADGLFSDGTKQDLTTAVVWDSSDNSIAVISNADGSRGKAVSSLPGTVTIIATSGTVSGFTTLTITPATLVTLAVMPPDSDIALRTSLQFTAQGTFTDATKQDLTTSVTWSSSSPGVATISNADGSRGLVTPLSVGTTTITAISGEISDATPLTVTPILMGGAIQGNNLSLAGSVSTIAGSRQWADGTGAAAVFNHPAGITSDGTYFYVTDTNNSVVRRIDPATGTVTTIAGQAGINALADGTGTAASFWFPDGIATDGTYLYIGDSNAQRIRKMNISTGAVETIVSYIRADGIAIAGGCLYVVDTKSNVVRALTPTGATYFSLDGLYAGANYVAGSADGDRTAARFNAPAGIATDGINLYIADTGNNTIRQIVISTGTVTTLAGTAGVTGTSDGTGSSARFNHPAGITTDGTNLYVSDTGNNTIRKIVISTGAVSTIAGTAGTSGIIDGTGTAALFKKPAGIHHDGTNLIIVDTGNGTIRRMVLSNGAVSTLAGNSGIWITRDGKGTGALFDRPYGVTTDGSSLYIADTYSNTIRKMIIATGDVTTIAGSEFEQGSSDGTGSAARFNSPRGITTDGTNLYVTDTANQTVRKIVIATGQVTTIAGILGTMGSNNGTGTAAAFNYPTAITTDGINLYLTDSDNHTIRRIVISTGVVTTIAGTAGVMGSADGTGTAATFYCPQGITTDGSNLYIVDSYNNTIRKLVLASGEVTTIAGSALAWGSADGTGTAARFTWPFGITTDGFNLYITDSNYTVRKMILSTSEVSTLAGSGGLSGFIDGTGTNARFQLSYGITTDGINVFVADSNSSTIRKIQ